MITIIMGPVAVKVLAGGEAIVQDKNTFSEIFI